MTFEEALNNVLTRDIAAQVNFFDDEVRNIQLITHLRKVAEAIRYQNKLGLTYTTGMLIKVFQLGLCVGVEMKDA